MLKHLTTHGNSAAIIIDKPILDILKIDMKTPLEITTDGRNLIISPVKDEAREKEFRSAFGKVMKTHDVTFKKLASEQ